MNSSEIEALENVLVKAQNYLEKQECKRPTIAAYQHLNRVLIVAWALLKEREAKGNP